MVLALSSLTVIAEAAADVRTGVSLTALTVIVKVLAALTFTFGATLLPLSVKTTLTVAVPFVLAAAV